MGDSSKVRIDNGNIVLNEGVFFDVGSYAIKPGAGEMLNQLSEVFQRFLSDENNLQYVDSIVISGHTDSTGNAQDNRTLSSNRANAVLGLSAGERRRTAAVFQLLLRFGLRRHPPRGQQRHRKKAARRTAGSRSPSS